MEIPRFTDVADFSSVLTLGRRVAGTTVSTYLDARPGQSNLFRGNDDMRQSFPVRPIKVSSLHEIQKSKSFEITLQVDGEREVDFKTAAGAFDNFLLQGVFERKDELLPKQSNFITSTDALKPLYVSGRFLKPSTGVSSAGTPYHDTIRLKIMGEWGSTVTGVHHRPVQMRGKAINMVDYLDWSPRAYTGVSASPYDTKFYLWVRKDEASGKDVYTDKVAMPGAGFRMVGPQDCIPGCRITPVFSMSHVYFGEGFGMTANARAIYIKAMDRIVPSGDGTEGVFHSATTALVPVLGDVMME